jgi:pilus assembly protein FimV
MSEGPHPEFEHTPTERQGVDMLPATADDMRFEVSDFAMDAPTSGLPSTSSGGAAPQSAFHHEGAGSSGVMPFPGPRQAEPPSFDLDPDTFKIPAHEPVSAVHEPEPGTARAPAEVPNVPSFATAYEPPPAELPSIPGAPRVDETTPSGMAPAIDFDFGDLSLDLDAPATKAVAETTSHGSEFALSGTGADSAAMPELELPSLDTNEPMARKIELADEFRRIGDHEGARELLEEVLAKAEGPLRSKAQTLLDALG